MVMLSQPQVTEMTICRLQTSVSFVGVSEVPRLVSGSQDVIIRELMLVLKMCM